MATKEWLEPLPYKYPAEDDPNREIIDKLIDDIKQFCNIDEEQESLPEDSETLWPLIWQTLRIISNITCWDDDADDLFLMQTRYQNYDTLVQCGCTNGCCDCDGNYVIIPLEYMPIAKEEPFVDGTISAMVNGRPMNVDISADYLNEHFDKARGRVMISRADFSDILMDGTNCCCLCQRDVTVMLEYNAGYDNIPAGLYPAICYILNKLQNGTDDTDCHDNMTQTSGLLKRKKVGNVEYEWSTQDTTVSKTANMYSDLHDLGMLSEVLALSRCYLTNMKGEIGDVV